MIVEYNIVDGIVYQNIAYPSGTVAVNAFGSEYNFRADEQETEYQKFVDGVYQVLETTETPKNDEGKIDYEAVNVRLNYWRSQGSAT